MSRSKKKNELMIDNNSSLMIEKLGNNIKKTIINKSIVYEKWSMAERKKRKNKLLATHLLYAWLYDIHFFIRIIELCNSSSHFKL